MEKKLTLTLTIVVALAITRSDGRILLQKRPKGKAMAGLWEFPGGKVEAGEAPEAALVREIDEELGVKVSVSEMQPITFATAEVSSGEILLLLYRANRWQGELRALHAEALQWVTLEEMRQLPMPPADAPFIDALAQMN